MHELDLSPLIKRKHAVQGYLKFHETVELTLRGITGWAYTKRGKYLDRVELNLAASPLPLAKRAPNASAS